MVSSSFDVEFKKVYSSLYCRYWMGNGNSFQATIKKYPQYPPDTIRSWIYHPPKKVGGKYSDRKEHEKDRSDAIKLFMEQKLRDLIKVSGDVGYESTIEFVRQTARDLMTDPNFKASAVHVFLSFPLTNYNNINVMQRYLVFLSLLLCLFFLLVTIRICICYLHISSFLSICRDGSINFIDAHFLFNLSLLESLNCACLIPRQHMNKL